MEGSCGPGAQRCCARTRVELRGEAVGGDWLELPGGELVEAFFVGGGGDF